MAKLDISQTIKEKRLIDEAMKYDEVAAKEIISRFHEARENFKGKYKLCDFYTQGICWVSMLPDFFIPMSRLLYLFNDKYPHALYISEYRHASTNPDDFSKVAHARDDEVYKVLVAMDLSSAAKILCELDIPEQSLRKLTNALSTKTKKEFLDHLSQCNLPELFLKSFKAGLSNNESLTAMLSFIKSNDIEAIPDDELFYGVRAISEMSAKEIFNNSEDGRENVSETLSWYDSMVDAIKLLSMPDNDKAHAYILDIDDTDEYLLNSFIPLFYNVAIMSRYLYPFLNEYERESLDIMFRERKGCIELQYNVEGKDEQEIFSLRTFLDELIKEIPYDKPFEKVSAKLEKEETETELPAPNISAAENAPQSSQKGFAGCYLNPKPENLPYAAILSIAKDLCGLGDTKLKKRFINPEDVDTFCWFFNGGQSVKEINFTKMIEWHAPAASLKFLIALMYGMSNGCELGAFRLQEGATLCIVTVFNYQMKRHRKSKDKSPMEQRKDYFNKKVEYKGIAPEDRQLIIEIVSKHVSWDLNFKKVE